MFQELTFVVVGMSGGFSDYRCEFTDLIEAIEDYKRQGFADCPSAGSLVVVLQSDLCIYSFRLR